MTLFLRPHPYIIVATMSFAGESRASILREGADACVGKPIVVDEVLAVVGAVPAARAAKHMVRSRSASPMC